MTTDTEVKPLTAEQAERITDNDPWRDPQRLAPEAEKALEAIADGRHEVIDKATHTAVEHRELDAMRETIKAQDALLDERKDELERLRADARRLDWAELHISDIEFEPVSHDHMRQPDGYVRRVTYTHKRDGGYTGPAGETFRAAIDLAIADIDAAQQEQEQ